MLKAVFLIFVELMLVTAIALCFSTSSSPMLSAAFTFGLAIVGHFSADLRNFQQVVDSPAAAALARALYWVLPNLAQFDVKSDVVHGVHVPLGYLAVTSGYAARLHRPAAGDCLAGIFPARFQVMNPRSPSALAFTLALAAVLLAAAVQLQAARERLYPAAAQTEESLYLRSGVAVRRLTGAYNALFADLYWIRTPCSTTAATSSDSIASMRGSPPGAVVAPPRDAYPLLYPLLDITTTLDPRFNMAYRFGSVYLAELYPRGAGRSDLAIALLQKGLRVRPDKWQYMQDIGFVYYWWVRTIITTAASWFEKASRGARRPLVPPLDGGDDAGGGRGPAVVARDVGGDPRVGRRSSGCARTPNAAWFSCRRSMRSISCSASLDDYARRTGAAPDDWAALVRARVLRGRCRSIRPACRSR